MSEIESERGSDSERERDRKRERERQRERRDSFTVSCGRRDSCATHSIIRGRVVQAIARIRAAGAGNDARLIETFARQV